MKIKILALILCMCMMFGIVFTGQITSAEKVYGDLDVNGVVNSVDMLLMRGYLANTHEVKDSSRVDCNNDGSKDTKDVKTLLEYLIKAGELYTEYENSWINLYDFEDYEQDEFPSNLELSNADAGATKRYDNNKNPFSTTSIALYTYGVAYAKKDLGTNPESGDYPTMFKVCKNNQSTELDTASNLRVLMKYAGKATSLSVIYIGFTFKGSSDKYYHRITLENYLDFNYFYFAGKEFKKQLVDGIKTPVRRTYLEDEKVETITLSHDDIKRIKNICIWFESASPTYPILVDDIDYYEGDVAFDGSTADDASLPQPEEPVNDGTEKYIAISFDDGPQVYSPTGRHYMDYYMDLAKEYDAKFTFFLIGSNCGSDDIPTLKRAVAEGHSLENHTMGHKYLSKMTESQIAEEVKGVETWLQQNVDSSLTTKYLRPPYLDVKNSVTNFTIYNAVASAGIKACIAGPGTDDYNNPSTDYEELYYKKCLGDGIISLNHEHFIDNVETIRRLLEYFTPLGYKFVTVDELFKAKGVTPTCDKMYCVSQNDPIN